VLTVLSAGAGPADAVPFCLALLVGACHLLLPLLAALLCERFGAAWRAHAPGADEEHAALKVRVTVRVFCVSGNRALTPGSLSLTPGDAASHLAELRHLDVRHAALGRGGA
jgi:hypothetical protein